MKTIVSLVSVVIFILSFLAASPIWADDAKHMEEGSGMKMDPSAHQDPNNKKHPEQYKDAQGHMKEGSAAKEEYDKSSDHKKMEEGSGSERKMQKTSPRREGS